MKGILEGSLVFIITERYNNDNIITKSYKPDFRLNLYFSGVMGVSSMHANGNFLELQVNMVAKLEPLWGKRDTTSPTFYFKLPRALRSTESL